MPDTTNERPRRADAERSIEAILDAAVDQLPDRPDASMAEISNAAGVSRQTVYAHFASREALLQAVVERALGRAVASIDHARLDEGTPTEALDRLVPAWWATVATHARVLHALGSHFQPKGTEAMHSFHGPILARLEDLAQRGQRAGEFDRAMTPGWLAKAFLGLIHTGADEVAAGRMSEDEAGRALAISIPRLFGVQR